MNVVWYRLRVSESQRHTPIKLFSEYPPPGYLSRRLYSVLNGSANGFVRA